MFSIQKFCARKKEENEENKMVAKGVKFPNPLSQRLKYSQLLKTSKFKRVTITTTPLVNNAPFVPSNSSF